MPAPTPGSAADAEAGLSCFYACSINTIKSEGCFLKVKLERDRFAALAMTAMYAMLNVRYCEPLLLALN